MTNAFAEAAAKAAAQPAQSATPQGDELMGNSGYDPLFGGEKLVSLFDKTIGIGVERTGIITKKPEERQSRFYVDGAVGKLKFWGPDGELTADTIGPDGKPLRPCMDTVIVLQTDYRLSTAELQERGLDSDEGVRGVFLSGLSLAAVREAIKEARLTNRDQLVGKRLTISRTGKIQKTKGRAWTWAARIESA